MAQIHISQIDGAGMIASGLTWYPAIPTIQVIDVTTDIEGSPFNDITKIAVIKQDYLQDLYFKAPVDIYRGTTLFAKAGEYKRTTRLDGSFAELTLNEKDTTNPFAVAVFYNYVNDIFGASQSSPAATPEVPALPANSMLVGIHYEPKQGDSYTPAIIPAVVDYFNTNSYSYSTTAALTLDFSYSQIDIFLSGTFNLTINYPTYWTGNTNPKGKTLVVRIHVLSGTPAVLWPVTNTEESDTISTFSTNTSKYNLYTVTHREKSGVNYFALDNSIYTK